MARMEFSTDRAPASRMDFYRFDRRSNSCSGSTGKSASISSHLSLCRHAKVSARKFEILKVHQHSCRVQDLRAKNNSLSLFRKICFPSPVPRRCEGRIAIVTNVVRDAVDGDGPIDDRHDLRTAKLRGPVAPTLATKLATMLTHRGLRRWQTSIGSPRRAPISRKPLRREGRCDHRLYLWFSRSRKFLLRGSPGACGHPAFPAPSPSFRGQTIWKTRARRAARSRMRISRALHENDGALPLTN
jgi:hypothetical protein